MYVRISAAVFPGDLFPGKQNEIYYFRDFPRNQEIV